MREGRQKGMGYETRRERGMGTLGIGKNERGFLYAEELSLTNRDEHHRTAMNRWRVQSNGSRKKCPCPDHIQMARQSAGSNSDFIFKLDSRPSILNRIIICEKP